MAKKILYHGTTMSNYNLIKEQGFTNSVKTWNCSGESDVYFYDYDKSDEDDEDYIETRLISQAFESAQITAAVRGVDSTELVVLKV